MNKKLYAIIISVVLVITAVFGGVSYYLNKPEIVAARAFTSTDTSSLNGSIDFKINVDEAKLMALPELRNNPFAALQVQIVKSALESSGVKVSYEGMHEGNKILLKGNLSLPQIFGKSTDFSLYADENGLWLKSGDQSWQKSDNKDMPKDGEKVNTKAVLDYIKSCPKTVNGGTITISMKMGYSDIEKIFSKETMDKINSSLKGGMTVEQVMNAVTIQGEVNINKNSRFFIPHPYVAKSTVEVKGDMSRLTSVIKDIPDDSKALLDAVTFTGKGTSDMQLKTGAKVEKPADIK